MWADEVGEEDLPLHWTNAGTVIKLHNNTGLPAFTLAKPKNGSKTVELENMPKLKTSMKKGTVKKMADSSLEEEEDDSSKYVRWETPGPPEPHLDTPAAAGQSTPEPRLDTLAAAGQLPSSERRLDVSLDTLGMLVQRVSEMNIQ